MPFRSQAEALGTREVFVFSQENQFLLVLQDSSSINSRFTFPLVTAKQVLIICVLKIDKSRAI